MSAIETGGRSVLSGYESSGPHTALRRSAPVSCVHTSVDNVMTRNT